MTELVRCLASGSLHHHIASAFGRQSLHGKIDKLALAAGRKGLSYIARLCRCENCILSLVCPAGMSATGFRFVVSRRTALDRIVLVDARGAKPFSKN